MHVYNPFWSFAHELLLWLPRPCPVPPPYYSLSHIHSFFHLDPLILIRVIFVTLGCTYPLEPGQFTVVYTKWLPYSQNPPVVNSTVEKGRVLWAFLQSLIDCWQAQSYCRPSGCRAAAVWSYLQFLRHALKTVFYSPFLLYSVFFLFPLLQYSLSLSRV